MTIYLILILSLLLNGVAAWYIMRLLRKFFFISEKIGDTYLIMRAFQIFVQSLYSMDSYHGEPMIQELIVRVGELNVEIDVFRDIFQYMLDEELEEEFNAAQEEASKPQH